MNIFNLSFGKDSMATLLLAIEQGIPIDRVMYCDIRFSDEISGEHPLMAEWIPEAERILKERFGIMPIDDVTDPALYFFEGVADALIKEGIGDVSELKNHRVVAEYSLIPEDGNSCVLPYIPLRITQLYSGEEVEKIVKERDEYKHRAEVAERALDIAEKNDDFFVMGKDEYLLKAEKELKEERQE